VRANRNRRPDWFKLADYAEVNSFNLFDWVPMLSHGHLWCETLSLNQPMSNERKAVYWEDYLNDVLPCNIHANRSAPTLLGPGWDREAILGSNRIIDDTSAPKVWTEYFGVSNTGWRYWNISNSKWRSALAFWPSTHAPQTPY